MLQKQILILQFTLVVILAGASAWLGRSWRQEGAVFFQEQERLGGVEKTRLVEEARKRQAEIIEDYESEARRVKGRLERIAIARSETTKEQGETGRVKKINLGTEANGFAIETITGIGNVANLFADLASTALPEDKPAYQIIISYLYRAAHAQEQLRKESWAPRFDCINGKTKAVDIARKLAEKFAVASNKEQLDSRTTAANQFRAPEPMPVKRAMSFEEQLGRQLAGLPDTEEQRALRKTEFDERVKEILSQPAKRGK